MRKMILLLAAAVAIFFSPIPVSAEADITKDENKNILVALKKTEERILKAYKKIKESEREIVKGLKKITLSIITN